MTNVTSLHTTPGQELYEQLDAEKLKRAIVVCFDEEGGFSFMCSEMDAGDMALAASLMQYHAAKASLGMLED